MRRVLIEKTPEGYEVECQGSERVYIYAHVTRALRKVRDLLEAPEPAADFAHPAQLAEIMNNQPMTLASAQINKNVQVRLMQVPAVDPPPILEPDPDGPQRRVCCEICSTAQDAAVIHPEQAQCVEEPGDWLKHLSARLQEIKARREDEQAEAQA